jgi:hypothetical protein
MKVIVLPISTAYVQYKSSINRSNSSIFSRHWNRQQPWWTEYAIACMQCAISSVGLHQLSIEDQSTRCRWRVKCLPQGSWLSQSTYVFTSSMALIWCHSNLLGVTHQQKTEELESHNSFCVVFLRTSLLKLLCFLLLPEIAEIASHDQPQHRVSSMILYWTYIA